jgi:hypothetical protein
LGQVAGSVVLVLGDVAAGVQGLLQATGNAPDVEYKLLKSNRDRCASLRRHTQ